MSSDGAEFANFLSSDINSGGGSGATYMGPPPSLPADPRDLIIKHPLP
jgi:hypothetical protein